MNPAGAASHPPTRRAWFAWGVVCLVWGTTYLAIKIGLETIPPFVLGGVRYVIAGAMLSGILVASGRRLPARVHWGRLAILGFFMLGLGNGGVVWGEQTVPSGLTALIIGTGPFWMVTVDALLPGGARLRSHQWTGLAIGFAGILVLVWPDVTQGGEAGRGFLGGVIALQVACLGWSVGSGYTRRHVLPADVLGSAALQMVFGGVALLVAATVLGQWASVGLTLRTGSALGYLIVAGSVVAFAAYSYALQHLPVAIVSLYTYINPIIAVSLGTLLLGEPFGMRTVVASVVIASGILVVRSRRG